MSIETGPDEKPSARADFYSALFWIVVGGAIVVAAWRMDRLQHLGATLYTAPGLVPGVLGAMLTLLGVMLAVRAARQGAFAAGRAASSAVDSGGWLRVIVVLVLCLGYAVGMVGHGVPFWLATLVFVFLFVLIFEYPLRKERNQVPRGVAMALVYAVCTSVIVSQVFEKVFYVRLP